MKYPFLKFKSIIALVVLFVMHISNTQAQSNEGIGMPGDNLNLSAVLDVFQQSKTLEVFEEALNSDDYKINNLDLNNDGQIDYIKVQDYVDGNLHSIVLQTDLNHNESQDLAVIYVEKNNRGEIDIQIVGDEDLYGKDYVIDVNNTSNEGTPNPGYNGYDNNTNDYNNYSPVSNWNIVVYMYDPFYNPWYSPWSWGYYPPHWYSWSPFFWNDYYFYCYHTYRWYRPYYYFSNRNRFSHHHNGWYTKNRKRANTYNQNRQNGLYDKTYQGKPPLRKPVANEPMQSGPAMINPGRIDRNNNRIKEKNDRIEVPVRTQPAMDREIDRNPQPVILQPITPKQEIRNVEPKPAQPIRQPAPAPRQIERPSPRPITPAPRPAPQRIENRPNNSTPERRSPR
ncbi:MAG: hypothetical protein IPF62_06175 [Bacteroidetes bacterium]|nr:hypothetical protein [Bacteroidota bacterium]